MSDHEIPAALAAYLIESGRLEVYERITESRDMCLAQAILSTTANPGECISAAVAMEELLPISMRRHDINPPEKLGNQ